MELSYQEDSNSKSSSEEIDQRSSDEIGTGRSYECVFCKRGFTTAQALGGHMNIHRKDRANNKTKITPSSSSKVDEVNYADLGFYSGIPIGGYQYHREVDSLNYHQIYNFPYGSGNYRPSQHVQYSSVENQRDNQFLFGQDWRKSTGLSLYNDPYENKDKLQNNTQDDHLDLELRLGHNP